MERPLLMFTATATLAGTLSYAPLNQSLAVPPEIAAVQSALPDETTRRQAQQFLTLPFRSIDAPRQALAVNEGWFYSSQEHSIHGKTLHRSIDWDVPRGTTIVAPADGYAVRSFQVAPTDKTYQGKPVGFGLGEFVEIWHPQTGLYTLYGHLQEADDSLPYVKSEKLNDATWDPTGLYVNDKDFMKKARKVARGDVIGRAGDSGIAWGYNENFDTSNHHIIQRDPGKLPSWDDTHLHFEVYSRSYDGRKKEKRYDPYDIYGQVRAGVNPYASPLREHTLFVRGLNGYPMYADEKR